jgi:hypothetical protein
VVTATAISVISVGCGGKHAPFIAEDPPDPAQGVPEVIVRRTPDGVSEVVYSEADDPRVKFHMSTIFTGP